MKQQGKLIILAVIFIGLGLNYCAYSQEIQQTPTTHYSACESRIPILTTRDLGPSSNPLFESYEVCVSAVTPLNCYAGGMTFCDTDGIYTFTNDWYYTLAFNYGGTNPGDPHTIYVHGILDALGISDMSDIVSTSIPPPSNVYVGTSNGSYKDCYKVEFNRSTFSGYDFINLTPQRGNDGTYINLWPADIAQYTPVPSCGCEENEIYIMYQITGDSIGIPDTIIPDCHIVADTGQGCNEFLFYLSGSNC